MLTCDEYICAKSLNEALGAMATHATRARFIAGATDLLPWAREGRAGDAHIPVLIDVSKIPELNARETAKGRVKLGAATPIQRFLDDPGLLARMPIMRHCAVWFADDQIRESATIGGNLVNASPAADASPPMLAHNARLEIARRQDGKAAFRSVSMTDFFTGPGRTALAPNELVVAVECDDLSGYGGSFQKVGHRRSLVISVACVAAAVRLSENKTHFGDVRLAIGGVGPVPLRLENVEALLAGAPVTLAVIEEAARAPLDLVNSRTRQFYRKTVLRGFVARALIEAAAEAGAENAPLCEISESRYA